MATAAWATFRGGLARRAGCGSTDRTARLASAGRHRRAPRASRPIATMVAAPIIPSVRTPVVPIPGSELAPGIPAAPRTAAPPVPIPTAFVLGFHLIGPAQHFDGPGVLATKCRHQRRLVRHLAGEHRRGQPDVRRARDRAGPAQGRDVEPLRRFKSHVVADAIQRRRRRDDPVDALQSEDRVHERRPRRPIVGMGRHDRAAALFAHRDDGGHRRPVPQGLAPRFVVQGRRVRGNPQQAPPLQRATVPPAVPIQIWPCASSLTEVTTVSSKPSALATG